MAVGDKWFDGIGYLVNDFVKKKPQKKLLLKPLFVEGPSPIKMIIHGWKLILGIKSNIKVDIINGQTIDLKLLKSEGLFDINDPKKRAKAIKEFLKKRYEKEFIFSL